MLRKLLLLGKINLKKYIYYVTISITHSDYVAETDGQVT